MCADAVYDDSRSTLVRREFLQLTAASAATAMAVRAMGATTDGSAAKNTPRQTVCVLGASGHVGGAIVTALLSAGYHVTAISRSAGKLQSIQSEYEGAKGLDTLMGDVSSDTAADQLRAEILSRFGRPSAIVAALSSPAADAPMRILDTPTDKLREAFNSNFFSHVTAAVALIPSLQPGGVYIGFSGGLADFVAPNMGALSMTESALRSLYSVLAAETRDAKGSASPAEVRLLSLYGLVATDPTVKGDVYIDARQIGIRVSEIVGRPEDFPGPLLAIKSKQYS